MSKTNKPVVVCLNAGRPVKPSVSNRPANGLIKNAVKFLPAKRAVARRRKVWSPTKNASNSTAMIMPGKNKSNAKVIGLI